MSARFYPNRTALAARYASAECHMLAQKVETRDQFLTPRKNGFTRFQGYFFRHPENLRGRQIPANQATYVRLLTAVSRPEVDFTEIENLIKHEPSLCYGLLRYLNSPLLGLSSPVVSVRNVLNLLEEHESVRWIRMATTLVMGQDKSSDLVLSSLVRARFCELIAPMVEHGNSDIFLMGMLSLIDSILAVPIGVVIEELCLDANINRRPTAGRQNRHENPSFHHLRPHGGARGGRLGTGHSPGQATQFVSLLHCRNLEPGDALGARSHQRRTR
jgi:c-di-GMP-related signal transduction protein